MIDTNESRNDATDRRTDTRHVHYDPASDRRFSEMLVMAVADAADTDPLEMDPLYETVDPDTLDDFVGTDGLPDVEGHVSFDFEGHRVRVHASGLLEIRPVR